MSVTKWYSEKQAKVSGESQNLDNCHSIGKKHITILDDILTEHAQLGHHAESQQRLKKQCMVMKKVSNYVIRISCE